MNVLLRFWLIEIYLQQRAQKLGLDIKFFEYSGQAESSLQGAALYRTCTPRNYSR